MNPNQQAEFVPRWDLYTMDVDCRRNCCSCGGFEHLARNYKNQRFVRQERRMEYMDSSNTNNLNGEESLVVLN